jgi:hypothetical protein
MDARVVEQGEKTRSPGQTSYVLLKPDGTIGELKRSHVEAYWRSVRKILRSVFDRRDAVTLVSNVRKRLDEAGPPSAHALFYHDSPLHVAADLAGVEGPLTEAQEARGAEIQGIGLA